ncbi:MAG: hypothetical protein QW474_00045 [Candidatus Aenigmatarchaeota archaeon]
MEKTKTAKPQTLILKEGDGEFINKDFLKTIEELNKKGNELARQFIDDDVLNYLRNEVTIGDILSYLVTSNTRLRDLSEIYIKELDEQGGNIKLTDERKLDILMNVYNNLLKAKEYYKKNKEIFSSGKISSKYFSENFLNDIIGKNAYTLRNGKKISNLGMFILAYNGERLMFFTTISFLKYIKLVNRGSLIQFLGSGYYWRNFFDVEALEKILDLTESELSTLVKYSNNETLTDLWANVNVKKEYENTKYWQLYKFLKENWDDIDNYTGFDGLSVFVINLVDYKLSYYENGKLKVVDKNEVNNLYTSTLSEILGMTRPINLIGNIFILNNFYDLGQFYNTIDSYVHNVFSNKKLFGYEDVKEISKSEFTEYREKVEKSLKMLGGIFHNVMIDVVSYIRYKGLELNHTNFVNAIEELIQKDKNKMPVDILKMQEDVAHLIKKIEKNEKINPEQHKYISIYKLFKYYYHSYPNSYMLVKVNFDKFISTSDISSSQTQRFVQLFNQDYIGIIGRCPSTLQPFIATIDIDGVKQVASKRYKTTGKGALSKAALNYINAHYKNINQEDNYFMVIRQGDVLQPMYNSKGISIAMKNVYEYLLNNKKDNILLSIRGDYVFIISPDKEKYNEDIFYEDDDVPQIYKDQYYNTNKELYEKCINLYKNRKLNVFCYHYDNERKNELENFFVKWMIKSIIQDGHNFYVLLADNLIKFLEEKGILSSSDTLNNMIKYFDINKNKENYYSINKEFGKIIENQINEEIRAFNYSKEQKEYIRLLAVDENGYRDYIGNILRTALDELMDLVSNFYDKRESEIAPQIFGNLEPSNFDVDMVILQS